MNALALTFRDTTFHPIIRDNQPWLTAAEIAKALGYSQVDAVSKIYRRNKDEFTPSMTAIVETPNLTVSGKSKAYGNLQEKVRIFSLRGAHLIGMFARTKLAAEFRRWVLDILDQYTAQLPQNVEETLLPSEQQTLSEIVHKRAEAYGQLQGKVLAQIWSRVHLKFRVARYSQLPRAKLSEAILYVTGMEIKAGKPKAEVPISHAQYHELKRLVYLIGNCFHYRNAAQWAAWATLRHRLSAESAAKIPAHLYGQASAILNDIQEAASVFRSAVMELETGFFERRFSTIPLEIKELERLLSQEEDEEK
jgi:prophage antirepressor-like protein